MKKSKLYLNRNFMIDRVDRRLFSSFIENGEMVDKLMYDPNHPTANANGMRQDTIDLIKELKIPMLRVSGNHNSAYNWKEGIGPREEREPRFDPAWERIDSNQVGLDEYDQWAKEIGAEVMPGVNLGTGTPNDARDMIEYTNHKGGSRYSNLRIKHGHQEPYNYKMWCLGNELDGDWQMGYQPIDHYPLKAEQAARMMKAIDPSIKAVVVGSSNSGMHTFIDWEYKTLMQAPELFDYVALHTYYGNHDDEIKDFLSQTIDLDQFIRGVAGVCEAVESKVRLDKKFYISVDEWNVSRHATYNFPYHTYNEKRLSVFPPYDMMDVLMVAMQLMTMINHSDRVKVACLSLITSLVWARTSYDVLKTTCYYPFQLMNRMSDGYALRQTLETEYYASKYYASVPMIETASILNDQGEIVVFAVSRNTDDAMELDIEASGFGEGLRVVSHTEIHDDDPHAINSVENPYRVVPKEVAVPEKGTSVTLKPLSFNVLVLRPESVSKDGADFAKLQEAGRPTEYISPEFSYIPRPI